jgi:hypothetical protein
MRQLCDIQTVDARAVFRIVSGVREIVPCHGVARNSTVV